MVKAPIKILLIAGQSNAVGTSVTGSLTGYEFSNVLMYQAGEFTGENEHLQNRWLQGVKPNMGYTPAHSGIELGICSALREKETYGIIRYAYGTTDLQNDWQPESAWDTSPSSMGDKGYCFLQWKNTFLSAVKKLNAPFKVVGLVFMQGESDSYHREGAEKYAENLNLMVRDMRQCVGEMSLPVLIGEIATPVSKYAPFADIVRKKQSEFCNNDCNAVLIPSKDLRLQDGWHYKIDDAIRLGERFGCRAKEFFE